MSVNFINNYGEKRPPQSAATALSFIINFTRYFLLRNGKFHLVEGREVEIHVAVNCST